LEKAKSMVAYAHQEVICRTQFIQEYFGEKSDSRCGICDWCVENKKMEDPAWVEKKLKKQIIETLRSNGELSQSGLLESLRISASEFTLELLRKLTDEGVIRQHKNGTLSID
jgi:ATP-dependent DNA helicase RecQ